MRLYLVQHGQPHPKEKDPDRSLTDKGREDVKKLASFLNQMDLKVHILWESGKKRATQTAEILSSAVLSEGATISEKKGIAPNDPVAHVTEELSVLATDHMIVGHMPFLSRLVSFLVLGKESPEIVSFQQGGLVCMQRDEDSKWTVAWMAVPSMI